MSKYQITDNESGDVLTIEADRAPSQSDANEIFASRKKSQPQGVSPEDAKTIQQNERLNPAQYNVPSPTGGTMSPWRVGEQEETAAIAPLPLKAISAGLGKAVEWTEPLAASAFKTVKQAMGGNIPPGGEQRSGPSEIPQFAKDVEPGKPMVQFPKFSEADLSVMPEWAQKAARIANSAGGSIESLTTPGSVATLAAAPESRGVQMLFTSQGLAAIPDQLQALNAARTPQEKSDAWASIVMNAGMTTAMAHGLGKKAPVAESEPMKVMAPEESVPKEAVPIRPVERPRASTQDVLMNVPESKKPETKAPAKLSDEEQAYLEAERGAMDVPVEVDESPGGDNEPFAGGDLQIATINRKTGSIVVRPQAFSKWLSNVPKEQRPAAVKSLLSEERLHLANSDTDALGYLGTLSGAERRIGERRYTGSFKDRLSDIEAGHELLRYRQQQLSRMTPREIAEAAGKEKWTLHMLDAVDGTIRKLRETFGGEKGDKIAQGILDRMERGSSVARSAILSARMKYDQLPDEDKKLYSQLHSEAMGARKDNDVNKSDDKIINAELGLSAFEELHGIMDMPKDETAKWAKGNTQLQLDGVKAGVRRIPPNLVAHMEELRQRTHKDMMKALEAKDYESTQAAMAKNIWLSGAIEGANRKGPNYEKYRAMLESGEISAEPSARIKKGKDTGVRSDQGEFFGAVTARGVPGAETVGSEERVGAADAGALPSVSGAELDTHARKFMAEEVSKLAQEQSPQAPPKFKDFVEHMKGKSPEIKPGQLHELWEKSVMEYLPVASGEELSTLLKSIYGRESIKGRQLVADPTKKGDVFSQSGEHAIYRTKETIRTAQQKRAKVISDVAYELMKPLLKEDVVNTRDTVNPEDVRYGGGERASALQEFAARDERDPRMLGSLLVDEARRSNSDPVSLTKRLTGIMDRKSGRVYLVSTFEDGRRGVVLRDPALPEHTPLEQMLKRYRVLSSVLLDEPVKNFKQTFDSLEDFNQSFMNEARGLYAAETSYNPPPVAQFMEGVEGNEAIEGEHGYLQGPHKGAAIAAAGGRGAIEAGRKSQMTGQEASAMIEHVKSEQAAIDSPDDVVEALIALAELPRTKTAGAVSGFAKLARLVQRANPDASVQEILQKTAQKFYEDHQQATSLDDFIARTSGRSSTQAGEAVRPQESKFARELTHLRDKPPTRDPNAPLRKADAPEAKLYPPKPPEMLSPEELRVMDDRLKDKKYGGEAFDLGPWSKAIRETAASEPPPGSTRYWSVKEGKYLDHPDGSFTPSARIKMREALEDEYSKLVDQMGAAVTRRGARNMIPALMDGAERNADLRAAGSQQSIILSSEKPIPNFSKLSFSEKRAALKSQREQAVMVRRASKAVLAAMEVPEPKPGEKALPGMSDFAPTVNPEKFQEFKEKCKFGIDQAEAMLGSNSLRDRRVGRKWKEAAEQLLEEVEYAEANYKTDPQLQATVESLRSELDQQFAWERGNGATTQEFGNYFPGRYDAEFFNDNAIMFGEHRLLGKQYSKSKAFNNYYEAIGSPKGPYIPASMDAANIVSHRVRQGSRSVNRRLWLYSLTGMNVDGQPVARPAKMIPKAFVTDAEGNQHMTSWDWVSPDPNYILRFADNSRQSEPIAVRKSFDGVVDASMSPSKVDTSWPVAKAALQTARALKHGGILILDTFHPGRLIQYSASLMGKGTPMFKGGYSALMYRPEDLSRAVANGHITESAAQWARQTIDTGLPGVNNHQQLAHYLSANGFNAAKIGDALYKDVVQQLPLVGKPIYRVIGPFNRWLFDKFLPGLMTESAVSNYMSLHQRNPKVDAKALARDIVTDMNTYYGNMGRQGVFRNQTFKDLSEIVLLAPLWQEGLIGKELRFAGRLTGISNLTGRRGLPQLGALGEGMARGLMTYFALTQVINLITRRQLTLQNKEKDHKWDAWIPLPGKEGNGLWLSPMSVFAEVTHDIIRLAETKATVWDGIQQFGDNKLGPIGKLALVLKTGKNFQGEKIMSTPRVLGTAAAQLIPSPISLGPWVREAGHAVAPSMVKPNEPGRLMRQGMASFGSVKTEVARSPVRQAQTLANQFMEKNGYKSEMMQLTPTDEPSYSRMRHAIDIGDDKTAKAAYEELKKGRTDAQILSAMSQWARRPMTGSYKYERQWMYDMSDNERSIYDTAKEQRMEMLNKFEDWIYQQP